MIDVKRWFELIAQRSVLKLDYRLAVVVCYLMAASIAATLWLKELDSARRDMDALARERGQMAFELIQLTRAWNAGHGGVYVPVTPSTPPNPNLDHPRRDLTSTDGQRLTMINPAYMTRQISELAVAQGLADTLQFHITSLRPIRPGNAPDAWEAAALKEFEGGLKEKLERVGEQRDDRVHFKYRYMAPLRVAEPCMQCHGKYGYKVGDVRGGISVTMRADGISEALTVSHVSVWKTWLALFLLLGALMHSLLWQFRRYAQNMLSIQRAQAATIDHQSHELAESEARYQAVFDTAANGIAVTDAQGVLLHVNPAMQRVTGYSEQELLGQTPRILKSGHHHPEFYTRLWHALGSVGHWEGEIWNRHKSGELFVAWLSINRINPDDGRALGSEGFVATYVDITDRKLAEEVMNHKAHHDALTQLPNRTLLADRLQNALSVAERHQRHMALLYLDLDRFKEVNDHMGHSAGDELLQQVAKRMQEVVRESDTLARIGGDEFAVLLSEISSDDEVTEIAKRLVDTLRLPYYLRQGEAHISSSIGIAFYPAHGDTIDLLRQHADEALYAVKHSGRDAYQVWSSAG